LLALYQNTNRITNHSKSLSRPRRELCFRLVEEKWNCWLPQLFPALLALSRWPELFPPGFIAAYALAVEAGHW